jgi:SpoVK/Ycf46/Vps4 family AAA+-type ATPase
MQTAFRFSEDGVMKLIIIYGPPAAGKLTVGSEIARLTGFKLFHNHTTIDCAKSVFDFGTPAFWRVVGDLRIGMIAEAARNNIDLIHTFCYELGADDEHFEKLIAAAEDNGGEAHLVLLRCDDEERRKRISNESRVKIGKLTDPASLDRDNKPELSTPLPGRGTLIIDSTRKTPDESAAAIIEHFGLQQRVITE